MYRSPFHVNNVILASFLSIESRKRQNGAKFVFEAAFLKMASSSTEDGESTQKDKREKWEESSSLVTQVSTTNCLPDKPSLD